ncbi:MAG TPA: AMP-binding protein [Gaiellaceae bacterium]|jgi:phenylacetate-coenzyme A ligase PaaK-like adenylate-forming protein
MTVAATGLDPLAPEALRARTRDLVEHSRRPREQRLELKRRRLRELLRYAVGHSPYYRDALGLEAEHAGLADLPTLSKPRLMEEFDRIVTDPRLRVDDLEAFLVDADAGRAYLGEYRIFATSGTTGVPGVFVYSHEEFAEWVALCLAALARIGITPETRIATVGAPSDLHISRRLFAGFVAGREAPPRLSVTTPIVETVAALNAYRPEAITTYASIADRLAEEQLEGRLEIDLRYLVVSAEVLTDEAAERIRRAWGVEATNVYASTESPYMANRWPGAGDPALEPSDGVLLEVVDEAGRPVAPGESGTKVLLTNLVNRAQPLIRYELSDSAAPTGDGRIARIDGRSDDILMLPAAGGGELQVHPFWLRAPFATLPAVRQYQIVLEPDGLRVRVVLRSDADPGLPGRIESELADRLRQAGAMPPRIDVDQVDSIDREPGHAAKLKLVAASAVSSGG